MGARLSLTAGSSRGSIACPLGIVVNAQAERFYDEGEDLWPKRYAIWGRLVAQQPDQIAYSIIDSKVLGRFMPSVFPAIAAASIAELAAKLGLAADKLEATVRDFNHTVRPGTFDHQILDDCRTDGLTPPKSHWAQRIDTPPFYGYPLRPGITFTYLGVRVNERAEVQGFSNIYLPRARSWPATWWARAIWRVSA